MTMISFRFNNGSLLVSTEMFIESSCLIWKDEPLRQANQVIDASTCACGLRIEINNRFCGAIYKLVEKRREPNSIIDCCQSLVSHKRRTRDELKLCAISR